ncbi:hypothetical protein GCM10007161_08860 [Ignatzschineria indica]|uniref:Competence protein ComEA n=1 Tax=Ignatzschineria indica TaxID=472583 RepID=A0A2U2ANP7_9GAMM|nr:helix-hairpin-helix domain-containing protein [Ignatzschineria indica]PWD84841.1 hypothetical protein DC082_04750 [Ignatzschineria indica]GGZ79529.1 hypothetical protein GCM10007161_08860 [Ignatzschineria indica]
MINKVTSIYKRVVFSISLLISALLLSLAHSAPININSADVDTIMENLTNVGPVKATAIVEYREQNGPFKRVEDLLAVKGIGEKTLEANRDNIIIDEMMTDVTPVTENTMSGDTVSEGTVTSDNRESNNPQQNSTTEK